METIKIFVGEKFNGDFVYSTKSFIDISDNNSDLMPGGFCEAHISKKDLETLENDTEGDYYLHKTKMGNFKAKSV